MKRAEWLRPFSFGNAIDSRPFSLGSVIGFSSILTMESARDDWLLVHSHNGEHALRLDEGRPTILRQVAPQRPATYAPLGCGGKKLML